MSVDPAQMGLQNPYESGPPPAAPAPSGAVNPDSHPPADIMEEAEYAASQVPDTDVIATTPNLPGGWLSSAATTAPGQAPTQTPAPGTSADPWESDANPYKQRLAAIERSQPNRVQSLQQMRAQLPQFAQQAHADLVREGYHPDHATQVVQLAQQAADADIQRQITESVTAPAARQMVADHIAGRFSTPNIKLTAADLASEGSPAAMEARARALVETGRTRAVQQRQAARVDTVESSASVAGGAAAAQPNMTPFEMIRSGVRSSRRR